MQAPSPFESLRSNHYAGLLVDPPWNFEIWGEGTDRNVTSKYPTMSTEDICALPVGELTADNAVLFMWGVWPRLPDALQVVQSWGFTYKTAAFCWMKANCSQLDLFRDDADVQIGMGYWARASSEYCLLATKGRPERLDMGVPQGIIEPRREHSRKPDCVYERIERLVAGPYLELFARTRRPGWAAWGNETDKF